MRDLATDKPEPALNVPLTVGLALVAMATSAADHAPAPKRVPDTRVSGVTVIASRAAPAVSSTYPAQGARVAPGLLVLRVTYNMHMRPEGWTYAQAGRPAAYPDCAKAPRLLDDKQSFVLVCRTLPGRTYAVWFNRPPLVDFASMSHTPAAPYELTFATTEDEPVRTLADAMKADPALAGQGEPVQAPGQARFGQDDAPPGY